MVLAVILGVVFGILAIVPLVMGSRRSLRTTADSNLSYMGLLLLTLLVALVILLVPIIVCAMVARDMLLFFAIADGVTFVVGVLIFGFIWSKRLKQ